MTTPPEATEAARSHARTRWWLLAAIAVMVLVPTIAIAAMVTREPTDQIPSPFALDAAGLRWRDHRVDAAALGATRRDLFVGYGSCSFDEPVEDLTTLGVLPVAP